MLKLLRFYSPRGIKLMRAEGQYVWDVEGRRYLDCHSAHGVAFLGHRNPRIIEAIKSQLERIMVASPIYDTEVLERVTELLERIMPKRLRYFYLLNSGSEAVELALKAARKITNRTKFISFINGFHGRSMGALAVTWNPRYRAGFEPFPWNVIFLPYNNVEAVEKAVDEDVAAVILEPIQGEGGLTAAAPEFLKAIRDTCDRAGALMIIDEVQAGFGRTGILWSHQRAGIEPDILVAGKAMGGGYPVSVAAFSEDIGRKLREGDHGSTFGGNPLAMAALTGGIETLLKDRVVERAAEAGEELGRALQAIAAEHEDVVRRVKGLGLMRGLELRFNPTPALKMLQEERVLALKAGLTVLRFLPAYLISRQDIEKLRRALHKIFEKFREKKQSP